MAAESQNGARVVRMDGDSGRRLAGEFPRKHVNIFDGVLDLESVALWKELDIGARSKQRTRLGKVEHPFNYDAARKLVNANTHHSACLRAKRTSTTGLGFQDEKTHEVLDDLCDDGTDFQEVLDDVGEDFMAVGQGYMEVVREDGQITGLHHCPASDVHVFVENQRHDRHYEIATEEALETGAGTSLRFARFGDLDDFLRRGRSQDSVSAEVAGGYFRVDEDQTVSELIEFRQPSALSQLYGFPDWLAAVSAIELVSMLVQHEFDFFLNRGVPEFLIFVTGQHVEEDEWKAFVDSLKSHIGSGNSFKSGAFNWNKELTVQVEKLGMEARDEGMFSEMMDTLSLMVVSAHRVPPVLAGIVIPGKLGATNEFPNALQAFQSLVVGPFQRSFERRLGRTLGGEKGVPGLSRDSFKMKSITDELDLGALDTVSRMRQPLAEAQAEGRDVKAGLRKMLENAPPKILEAFEAALERAG